MNKPITNSEIGDPGDLIKVSNLCKYFDDVLAVDNLSFSISKGELFGFLGPNGAGKTTTINMLTGLARPDSGSIHIAGLNCSRNPKAAQHLIGVVPDESNLYPELSGFDNLCFCASLYGVGKKERHKRAEELLKFFDLEKASERKFSTYSKGMKRKLTIAAGIIHRPQILFLDEPTTGIDVASARQIRRLITKLYNKGTTIFLTTHYIEEAERLCGRIAFIVNGHIVKNDSVANLIQPIKDRKALMITATNFTSDMSGKLSRAFPEFQFHQESDNQIRVSSEITVSIGPVVRFIEEQGAEVTEARQLKPSLEEVFVQVTGIEAGTMKWGKNNGIL